MGYDVEELKFIGMIHTVAEDDFDASVTEDEGEAFVKNLYREYLAVGKPANPRQWIRQRLQASFLFVAQKPTWVGSGRPWPFFEGRPMVFIGQQEVPETAVSKAHASPGTTLYLFGAKKTLPDIPHGWEMVYRVVEQEPGL